jgi:carboxy-terminal domain RNA polymerase II polypeptide A small phosphatase
LNGVEEPMGGHYLVYKRPHLDKFLQTLSTMGEIHIFTASSRSYADPVIDMIDPEGYITGRYYREHCTYDKKGNIIKQVEIISKNKQKMIIIDDSEEVFNMYKGKLPILF